MEHDTALVLSSCSLPRETLNCGEITVFRAAREWARAECARRETEPTPDNMRSVGEEEKKLRI